MITFDINKCGDEKYKSNIILLFVLSISIYCFANIASYHIDNVFRNMRAKHHDYRNDVSGKNELMKALYLNKDLDMVFIGNSMTKEHIDTHLFYENEINIFNYGLEGYFIAQYPAMIENAIRVRPKKIVISMQKLTLFLPYSNIYMAYNHDNDVNLKSIYFLARLAESHDQINYVKQLMLNYAINLNYFVSNGYKISNFISNQYHHFNVSDYFQLHNQDSVISQACDFDRQGKVIPDSRCNNGDSVLIGNDPHVDFSGYKNDVVLSKDNFNVDIVNVLNAMFDRIKENGIEPVLVFIPTFDHYIADDQLIRNRIHAKVVDLSDSKQNLSGWYDRGHYNISGRKSFSQALISVMKSMV